MLSGVHDAEADWQAPNLMSRQRNSLDPRPRHVNIYWKCTIVNGNVSWDREDSRCPHFIQVWGRANLPIFDFREMPIPYNGMRVWTQQRIREDGDGDPWAGQIVKWAYQTGGGWVAMSLPTAAERAAEAAAAHAHAG